MKILQVILLTGLIFSSMKQPLGTNADSSVAITSPLPGQVLQGVISVIGSCNVEGFLSAEVAFSYSNDMSGTYFLITRIDRPVVDGILTTWDTTRITDGDYSLRLRVYRIDGSVQEAIVQVLRVRNYNPTDTMEPSTPTTTATSTQTHVPPTVTVTSIPSRTPLPSPTRLSGNPVILPIQDIRVSVLIGSAFTGFAFLSLFLYSRLRRK